jgi:spore maturation protein CgeB
MRSATRSTSPAPGLDDFFEIGREIIVADSPDDVLRELRAADTARARRIGRAARRRVLAQHTAERRALELERYLAGTALAHSA